MIKNQWARLHVDKSLSILRDVDFLLSFVDRELERLQSGLEGFRAELEIEINKELKEKFGVKKA